MLADVCDRQIQQKWPFQKRQGLLFPPYESIRPRFSYENPRALFNWRRKPKANYPPLNRYLPKLVVGCPWQTANRFATGGKKRQHKNRIFLYISKLLVDTILHFTKLIQSTHCLFTFKFIKIPLKTPKNIPCASMKTMKKIIEEWYCVKCNAILIWYVVMSSISYFASGHAMHYLICTLCSNQQ